MDFGLLASDNNLLSSDNGENAADADVNKQKCCYGFGFLKQERAMNEEDFREFKMAKTSSSCGEGVLRYPLQRSNGCILSAEGHQQMLSFSSPNSQQPTALQPNYYHYTSNAFARNTGMQLQGVRGPFTPSQWMELEHQALIYKYITANVPIPSYLLNPIRKAFESAGFSSLRSNALGWGGFQLGFSNTDPEPGRCRRTDGKKWRCARDAVVDQKYCERHMNRGRHRSRKPVEGQPGHSAPTPTPTPSNTLSHLSGIPTITRGGVVDNKAYQHTTMTSPKANAHKHQTALQESEFGLVCSDSLLNPLHRSPSFAGGRKYGGDHKSQHALRQFMDEWPKNQSEPSAISWPDVQDLRPDRTQLSISIPIPVGASDFMSSTSSPTNEKLTASPLSLSRELDMGLSVGSIGVDRNQRQTSWVPITWEPTSIGGPLGEALHNTSNNGMGDCSHHAKQLNLIDRWDNSPRLASSPTGVLQRGAFASLSNSSAASSPRAEGSSHCNGMINPSLPAL
ncbi:hypothetical protein C2S52_012388 [Perilla frutescens var. hirtella]|nr:hypothetical protein C2S52_012388 [Perilla frutescens var. hirtella]